MVIFLAGLQGIPPEVLEAAELDGAGPVRKLWSDPAAPAGASRAGQRAPHHRARAEAV